MSRAFRSVFVPFVVMLGAVISVAPTVHASSTKSGSTRADVRRLDHFRTELERDLGRPIRADEWPHILFDATPDVDGWNGPYARPSLLTDSWGNPLVLQPEVGVYSFGADRIDDRGMKDDIASWRSVDRSYYPKPPIRLQDLPLLLIQPALLLSLFGIPAWWVFGRRKPDGARR